ncbi:hypothetical protein GCM10010207_41950 [Streptomyces atratus]|nr:hypothetical protein GCM10010207_41950 [Streptomyces atratus]
MCAGGRAAAAPRVAAGGREVTVAVARPAEAAAVTPAVTPAVIPGVIRAAAVTPRAVAAPRAVAGADAAEAADTGQLIRDRAGPHARCRARAVPVPHRCPADELPPGTFLLGLFARYR